MSCTVIYVSDAHKSEIFANSYLMKCISSQICQCTSLEASIGSSDASAPLSATSFRDLMIRRSIVPSLYASLCKECNGITTCALGWLIQNLGSRTLISHVGGLVGFGSCVYLLPEEGFGSISMAMTMGSSNTVGNRLFFRSP
jgi:hypothetical protein